VEQGERKELKWMNREEKGREGREELHSPVAQDYGRGTGHEPNLLTMHGCTII
jgi:hypothetical protein